MLLFYVRHGDPIYEPDSLTPLGVLQSEALAKRLALFGIDRIYASTSTRAIQTAQPVSELTNQKIELLDFCNEKYAAEDFLVPNSNGGYQWVFQNEMLRRQLVSEKVLSLGEKWYDHPMFASYRFKTGMVRIHRETDRFLSSLGYEHNRNQRIYTLKKENNDRIALFAHQGFGLCFLSSLLDIPYPQFSAHFDMAHSSMTVVEFQNADGIVIPKILTMSNDSHLYKEELPTNYQNRLYF